MLAARRLRFALSLALCLSVPPAEAQPSPAAAIPASAPLPASSPAPEGLIQLDVVATDSAGRPIAGLARKDFTVFDAGHPAPILSFAAWQGALQPNPPTAVILLLDTLAIPPRLATLEHQQIDGFLRQNHGQLPQPISLLLLDNSGLQQVGSASADGTALADALLHRHFTRQFRSSTDEQGTAFSTWEKAELTYGDPVARASLQSLGSIAAMQRRLPGRKMLLWVGPGWGTGSGKTPILLNDPAGRQKSFDTLVWFATLLRDAHLTLYSFSAGAALQKASSLTSDRPTAEALENDARAASPQQMTAAALNRNVLAVASGGRALPPATNLISQINTCLREARAFYTLSFNPAPAQATNEYHDLEIRIDLPGVTARTMTRYYDEPYYTDDPSLSPHALTVAQLHQMLEEGRGLSDSDLAHRLRDTSLSERLSLTKLTDWSAQLPGKKSREALSILAGRSAFLDPPAADILNDPPPNAAAQQQILARAIAYLTHTVTRLPDFFARRNAALYINTPASYNGSLETSHGKPLHLVRDSTATVLYREGSEIVDAKTRKSSAENGTLSTYGTFGPVLTAVLDGITHPENLAWSRWESAPGGRRAVFRLAVPVSESRYVVGACCLPGGDGTTVFARRVAYHGEIAVDPQSGAILRVMIVADLAGVVPLDRSAIMVSYGPISIGTQTYFCPLRSISIMHSRNVDTWKLWDESFRTWGPWISMLNDFSFSDYHMFHAGVRILGGSTLVPAPPQAGNSSAAPH